MSGEFTTTWGTIGQNPFISGSGIFDYAIPANMAQGGSPVGAVSGPENGSNERPQVLVAASFPDGKVRLLVFNVNPEIFKAGGDAPFDWQSVFGMALDATQQGMPSAFIGFLSDGQFHLNEAAIMPGAPVSGSFVATVMGPKM